MNDDDSVSEYQNCVDAFDSFFDAVLTHAQALPLPEWQRYRTARPHAPSDGLQMPKNATREEVLHRSASIALRKESCDSASDCVPVAVVEGHPVYFSAHYGAYCWFGTNAGWSLAAALTYPANPIAHRSALAEFAP
ncbi:MULTISPECIES: hypothetical protein [Xanthomonas]|uniref:hypothetical protein n=1 Tax=Xanthomonas TaxID=338 RepID=UPI0011B02E77|nr:MULTISPECIES: hypothetical protein [Xanthomonas]MCM5525500.1 hypothetical protein [Xanthomonas hortorum pv. pelargonii]MCM5537959.1 hypothetical protein [Xanthomonas hortorum pv. pelargonii]MCM5542122.1 hypothetical protein [Xanthomonas hortorum pv. pelargonii]MCM5545779.1 hypothetical protein [Xanthomonas hortorum pv. pelargonii]MCM5548694.1 hypothetical protein [Xanthomonas hortorum pv. pelargonii]